MIIRDAKPEDSAAIERFHVSSGLDYKFPDLAHPLFFVRKVAERDGAVIGACFLRIAAETYLWLRPSLAPREKQDAMLAMQPEVMAAAWRLGVDEVEARIPPEIEKKFHKRLTQLGWSKNRGWSAWSRQTAIIESGAL